MDPKKRCIRCQRLIDAGARLCPFCNVDQSTAKDANEPTITFPPLRDETPKVRPEPERPKGRGDRRWPAQLLVIAAIVVALGAVFAVGGLVYGLGRRGESTRQQIASNDPIAQPQRELSDLTLVPENDPTANVGRSITSSPIPDPDHKVPPEFQRTDATALPSEEYSRIIELATKRPVETTPQQSLDPRTITTPAIPRASETRQADPAPARESDTPPRSITARTRPEPVDQPLPRINGKGDARLVLTIGADGRVKEVQVIQTISGETSKLIAAVQRWRFKPATENGVPVESQFPVDISFTNNND